MNKHKEWLQGYDCAVIDMQMVIKENKKLFAPSTYKTFINRLADKMVDEHQRTDFINFMTDYMA